MVGCINEYTSRRVNFELCVYWTRDNREVDLNKFTYENKPSGKFYARETNAFYNKQQDFNNTFLFDEETVSIETLDFVNIKPGDIVKFEDELWRVVDVQKRHLHKQKQFLKTELKKTFISLKR